MAASTAKTGVIPRVGIIYSDSTELSNESKNLAYFIAGSLALTGYAVTSLVGLHADGTPSELPSNRRVAIVPPGKSKAVDVPAADLSFSYWNDLETCHVIVVTINTTDIDICSTKLGDVLQAKPHIVTFCLLRGVKSGNIFKDKLTAKCSAIVLECAVGFASIQLQTGAYACTISSPCMIMERLSKEVEKKAIGPAHLMEAMNVEVIYRKVLTAHSWGIIIFEHLYALNAISGGTVAETLGKYRWRMVYAAMVRESYKALQVAARGGAWRPEFESLSWCLTPWLLEMLLALPWPLFPVVNLFLGLPSISYPSPAQQDLVNGRATMASVHLAEMVQVGKKSDCDIRVLEVVLKKLRMMEAQAAISKGSGSSGSSGGSNAPGVERMNELEAELQAAGGMTGGTVHEQLYWGVRLLTVFLFVAVLYFLFIHE